MDELVRRTKAPDAETLFDRVCVCGGRTYANRDEVWRMLDQIQPRTVIHGNATGADTLAGEWAAARSVPVEVYAPSRELDGNGRDWKFNRNSRMLRDGEPTLVIAFPGGPGTADTVRKAVLANIPTIRSYVR